MRQRAKSSPARAPIRDYNRPMEILAGTSGFSYAEWKGSFYPADLASKDMLHFYAGQLPAVEINNTFYRLPKESVLSGWISRVPQSFAFAIKASRRITHMKRLKDCADETAYLIKTVATLGPQLGALLFQWPPYLRRDVSRLASFLELVPAEVPAAFEFRHESWLDDSGIDLLRARNRPLVWVDQEDGDPQALPATADWAYLRLRRAGYDKTQLTVWHERLKTAELKRALVFFKHEEEGAGPQLARDFLSLV